MCTLRDLAVVAHLCNRLGTLQGREYLSLDYMREAVSCQVPTDLHPVLDEQCGYGFFIWMPREEGFTFFGMGGQLAVCFPQYDFCYVLSKVFTLSDWQNFWVSAAHSNPAERRCCADPVPVLCWLGRWRYNLRKDACSMCWYLRDTVSAVKENPWIHHKSRQEFLDIQVEWFFCLFHIYYKLLG